MLLYVEGQTISACRNELYIGTTYIIYLCIIQYKQTVNINQNIWNLRHPKLKVESFKSTSKDHPPGVVLFLGQF